MNVEIYFSKLNKKKTEKKTYEKLKYDIKSSCFNPDKNSPPNIWTIRLLERINNSQEFKKSFNHDIK
jgi:hypothetical protein